MLPRGTASHGQEDWMFQDPFAKQIRGVLLLCAYETYSDTCLPSHFSRT